MKIIDSDLYNILHIKLPLHCTLPVSVASVASVQVGSDVGDDAYAAIHHPAYTRIPG